MENVEWKKMWQSFVKSIWIYTEEKYEKGCLEEL